MVDSEREDDDIVVRQADDDAAWDEPVRVGTTDGFERAVAVADLPDGAMRCVTIGGREVLIANAGGEVLATDDTCTHEDASLSCGVLSGAIVRCPLHGATFDLRDGAPLDEPAEEALRCHEVKIESGAIFVRLREE